MDKNLVIKAYRDVGRSFENALDGMVEDYNTKNGENYDVSAYLENLLEDYNLTSDEKNEIMDEDTSNISTMYKFLAVILYHTKQGIDTTKKLKEWFIDKHGIEFDEEDINNIFKELQNIR